MTEKDPICGMDVDPKVAKRKGLTVEKEGKTYYFCSQSCKDKFSRKNNEPWYRSEGFGKVFPWVLGILLIGFFVLSLVFDFMILYMGIFFIVFSLMKMLDWKGFVNAFSMYDLIAKRVRFYGWIYPGIEFALGIMFLFNLYINVAAWVTIFALGIGAIGVGKNMLSKNKVQCACLGTKINVPLTKVTLLEDILMVVMASMMAIPTLTSTT